MGASEVNDAEVVTTSAKLVDEGQMSPPDPATKMKGAWLEAECNNVFHE